MPCIYCGMKNSAGNSCIKSPTKYCIVVENGKCSYCGQIKGSSSCHKSPTKYCVVPNPGKCSYCGQNGIGSSCYKSPTGKCNASPY